MEGREQAGPRGEDPFQGHGLSCAPQAARCPGRVTMELKIGQEAEWPAAGNICLSCRTNMTEVTTLQGPLPWGRGQLGAGEGKGKPAGPHPGQGPCHCQRTHAHTHTHAECQSPSCTNRYPRVGVRRTCQSPVCSSHCTEEDTEVQSRPDNCPQSQRQWTAGRGPGVSDLSPLPLPARPPP